MSGLAYTRNPSGGCATLVRTHSALTEKDGFFSQTEGQGGINQVAVLQGSASQQQAEAHGFASGEAEFYGKGIVAQGQAGFDEITQGAVSAGITNLAPINDRRDTNPYQTGVLAGMDAELNPALTAVKKGMQFKGMQGRGAGTGVEFGLDRGQVEAGKGSPFAPAQDFFFGCASHFGVGVPRFVPAREF